MKLISFVLVGLCGVVLGGCRLPGAGVAQVPSNIVSYDSVTAMSQKYTDAVCTRNDKSKRKCDNVGFPKEDTWLAHINECQSPRRNDETCEIYRNAIINEMVFIADYNYQAYEGNLIAGRAKTNFYTGAVRTTLETAGALITVADTTRILSGLAAMTGAIQESANTEFFFDNTIDALIIQMRADRARALVSLVERRTLPYGDYSIEQAVGDITNYYRAGTLASAVISISKSASEAQKDAEKNLSDSKEAELEGMKRRNGRYYRQDVRELEGVMPVEEVFEEVKPVVGKGDEQSKGEEEAKGGGEK